MLTKELLKSDAKLAGLTDEQLTAIETLSRNDEDQVIGQKTKEIWDSVDTDLKQLTGKEKPGGVKSYDHLKTVVTELKKTADSAGDVKKLTDQIKTLETEKSDLQDKLKKGSNDEALKTQIASLEQRVKDKESELTKVKSTLEEEKTALTKKLENQQAQAVELQLNHAFDAHLVDNKIKFKGTIPEDLLKETLTNRKAQLMQTLKPDWVDDGSGGRTLVFRDDKGEIMRNKENGLNPFTAGELFVQKIGDLIDGGQQQNGGGTKPAGGGGGGTPTNLDLSGVKNQIQADELIVSHILTNEKIAKTDPRFAERQKAIREEYKIAELPIRGEGGE